MISNTGTAHSAAARIGLVSSDKEFAAYDSLPAALRRKIAQAPVKFMAADIMRFYLTYGIDAAEEAIDGVLNDVCPGYHALRAPTKRRARA
jgi:hypothetical protein